MWRQYATVLWVVKIKLIKDKFSPLAKLCLPWTWVLATEFMPRQPPRTLCILEYEFSPSTLDHTRKALVTMNRYIWRPSWIFQASFLERSLFFSKLQVSTAIVLLAIGEIIGKVAISLCGDHLPCLKLYVVAAGSVLGAGAAVLFIVVKTVSATYALSFCKYGRSIDVDHLAYYIVCWTILFSIVSLIHTKSAILCTLQKL